VGLSEKEKQKLKEEGRKYKILEQEVKIKIFSNKKETEKLERELLNSMPTTSRGQLFCKECGVKSMKYEKCDEERRGFVYACEICGGEYLDEFSKCI
jgi:predicted SprT family Zn-dependent metalloprotease